MRTSENAYFVGLLQALNEMIHEDSCRPHLARSNHVRVGEHLLLPFPSLLPGFSLSCLLLPGLHNPLLDTCHESGTLLGTAQLQNYLKNLMSQRGKHFGSIGADLSWRRRGDKFTLWLVVSPLSASSHLGSLI